MTMPKSAKRKLRSIAKSVNIKATQPSLLRQQLGLPPDERDIQNHIAREWRSRVKAVDVYFGLDTNASNLPERRAKSILGYVYGIPIDSPDWWPRLSWELMVRHIPGFSIERRGRPSKNTFDVLASLWKDMQDLKARSPDLKGQDFFVALRSRQPWVQYGIPALRKVATKARALARMFPNPTVPRGPRTAVHHKIRR